VSMLVRADDRPLKKPVEDRKKVWRIVWRIEDGDRVESTVRRLVHGALVLSKCAWEAVD